MQNTTVCTVSDVANTHFLLLNNIKNAAFKDNEMNKSYCTKRVFNFRIKMHFYIKNYWKK